MPIEFIHARLGTTALIFSAICVAWGLLNFVRRQPVTGSYWGALVILELLSITQVVIGLLVFFSVGSDNLARPIVHALYGATLILSLPAAYVYSKGKDTRNENLIYALVCLWLVFIVERSISTGQEGMPQLISLLF